MAQRTQVVLISDLSGEEITDGDGTTLNFTVNGVSYEMDVTSKEEQQFDAALQKYIGAARRTGGRRSSNGIVSGRRAVTSSDYDAKAVRRWAKSNNIDVPARGRIPATVLEQFKAADN